MLMSIIEKISPVSIENLYVVRFSSNSFLAMSLIDVNS